MSNPTDQTPRATVELHKDGHSIKLSLRVGTITVGPLVPLAPDARIGIEPCDEMAATYTIKNWMSGIISGVAYATRKLKMSERRIFVEQLEGRLSSDDMEAVASAAVLAVARLADKECPPIDLDGWSESSPADVIQGPNKPSGVTTPEVATV